MKKFLFILLVLLGFTIMGCSKEELSGESPPIVYIKIGDEKFETKLGTYCWTRGCVDMVITENEPIRVKSGEKITLIMDYEPKPNEFYLSQVIGNNKSEIFVKENVFSAPTEKGIYNYTYGVWWMDEEEENKSHGDAFYEFALDVE